MKNCAMCGEPREDVSTVQVAPATWNGFHNFADVCATCQESRRFKLLAKAVPARAKAKAAAAAAAEIANRGPDSGTSSSAVQIAHRRTGVVLMNVDSGALAGADLSGAALSGADLQNAALRNANLQKADLHLADLNGADLRGADLRAVNFRGADLRGADLRETRLHRADLNHCLYNDDTRWPAGFDPRTSGAQKDGRQR